MWSALYHNVDATQAFFLGAAAALSLVLILELWRQPYKGERRAVETAIQAMREGRSP